MKWVQCHRLVAVFMPILAGMSCVLLICASNFAPYFFFHKVISYHLKKKKEKNNEGVHARKGFRHRKNNSHKQRVQDILTWLHWLYFLTKQILWIWKILKAYHSCQLYCSSPSVLALKWNVLVFCFKEEQQKIYKSTYCLTHFHFEMN